MFTFKIERLVPRFILNDRNGYALAKAIETGLREMNEIISQSMKLISDYDSMPEWRLDELAWEYDVDWYNISDNLDVKRRTIAKASEFYIDLGTPGRIKSIVESIAGEGSVEEWFEYSGTPFHFDVYANGNAVTAESDAKLKAMIEKGKNVRSVLDHLYYTANARSADAWALTSITGREGQLQGIAIYEED